MNEVVITTQKLNPMIEPALHIWGWQVSAYLFLGGLAAGIMIVSALAITLGREEGLPVAAKKLPLWAPIVLTVGMGALFLDLEFKLHVWRFYAAFKPTSAMSWGSWILLLVMPVSALLACATLRENYPGVHGAVRRILPGRFFKKTLRLREGFDSLLAWSEQRRRALAHLTLPCGLALGIYTGILLSSLGARPFWNNSVLAPIFLSSGVSAALAFAMLWKGGHAEKSVYGRLDLTVIVVEAALIGLMLLTMLSSGRLQQHAVAVVFGGPLTFSFWVVVFAGGLCLPAILEWFELKGRAPAMLCRLSPLLVLAGGYLFRDVVVQAGQLTGYLK